MCWESGDTTIRGREVQATIINSSRRPSASGNIRIPPVTRIPTLRHLRRDRAEKKKTIAAAIIPMIARSITNGKQKRKNSVIVITAPKNGNS
jgi:hypothetical protein